MIPSAMAGAEALFDNGIADPIIVSSRSGDATPLALVPGSVTVIGADELELRQTRLLADVLRDVPGVEVSRLGATGAQTQVRIRGSESNHVLVFVDGIKASDSYQGEFDFATLLADPMARVEVLRGPQSALYGSDALGGVISYQTLSGREAPGVVLRAEGGSMATFSTAGRAAGTLGSNADFALSASYFGTHGYPAAPGGTRDLHSRNLGLASKFGWTPTAALRLRAVARYGNINADIDDQNIAPSSPVVQGFPVVTTVDTPGRRYRNRSFYGLLGAEFDPFQGLWTLGVEGQIADIRRDNYDSFGLTFGDRGQRYRGTVRNVLRFGDARIRNRFTLAVDAEREDFRAIDPTGYAYTGQHRIDTLGVVAEYSMVADERLALDLSARIDDSSLFQSSATYGAGVSYLLPTGTKLHASFGSGLKAPNAIELFGYSDGVYIGNPALHPERSRGVEAGIEQQLLDGRASLGATLFRNRFTDRIETVFTFQNGQYLSTTRNDDGVTHQKGIEIHGKARLGAVRLDGGFTYLDAPQTVEAVTGWNDGSFPLAVPVETQAVRRAKYIASGHLAYAPQGGRFSAELGVRYNGGQRDYAFTDSYQQLLVDLKPFTLVSANLAFELWPGVALTGRIENALGRDYQEVFTYRGAPRAGYLGLRAGF